MIFDEHKHQIGMMRWAMGYIKTPLILYVEQDTPLVTDEEIWWYMLQELLFVGESNLIRFHFEGKIPKEHQYLMIGQPVNYLQKTAQWSQRPHLATAAFYKRILQDCFSPDAKCFIEDVMHGKVIDDFMKYGEQGWNQWRIHIYYPSDQNIKRSLNLDGRQGQEKYDEDQVW